MKTFIIALSLLLIVLNAEAWEMFFGDAQASQGQIIIKPHQKAGYLVSKKTNGRLLKWSCSAQVKGRGTPVANYGPNQPGLAPNVRPMLAGEDSSFRFKTWGLYARWWYDESLPLQTGQHQLNIKLDDLSKWTNVWGKPANLNAATIKGYNRARNNNPYIVYTFGGNSNFGKGVTTRDYPLIIKIQENIHTSP